MIRAWLGGSACDSQIATYRPRHVVMPRSWVAASKSRAGIVTSASSSTGEAGDKTGARDQFAALLPVAERVLGPGHPRTLNYCAGLARWTGGMKNAAGARDQFATLLPMFERILGPEHPETLYIRHSLARWTGQAGDPASARDQFAVLLPLRARVLGPDHPDTLTTRRKLAD